MRFPYFKSAEQTGEPTGLFCTGVTLLAGFGPAFEIFFYVTRYHKLGKNASGYIMKAHYAT